MISRALKKWFTAHAVLDLIFGVPLLISPLSFLTSLGWTTIDLFASRMAGAALVSIAFLSIYCNKTNNADVFKSALHFKSIWSVLGVLISLYTAITTEIKFAWTVALIFLVFSITWNYYRVKL